MSQTFKGAFRPIHGATVSLACTTTSANVAIPTAALLSTAIRVVFTAGTAGARIRSGVGSGTTAVAADMLVNNPATPWAYAECFGINANDTYIAAKTDAGTCTIEITFGYGA